MSEKEELWRAGPGSTPIVVISADDPDQPIGPPVWNFDDLRGVVALGFNEDSQVFHRIRVDDLGHVVLSDADVERIAAAVVRLLAEKKS